MPPHCPEVSFFKVKLAPTEKLAPTGKFCLATVAMSAPRREFGAYYLALLWVKTPFLAFFRRKYLQNHNIGKAKLVLKNCRLAQSDVCLYLRMYVVVSYLSATSVVYMCVVCRIPPEHCVLAFKTRLTHQAPETRKIICWEKWNTFLRAWRTKIVPCRVARFFLFF
jgi:hypothetical protein